MLLHCEHCGNKYKGEHPADPLLMYLCAVCEQSFKGGTFIPGIGYLNEMNDEYLLCLVNTVEDISPYNKYE